MARITAAALAVIGGALVPAAAGAQGFTGSGAAGYAQSQGWTASAGIQPKGADGAGARSRHARSERLGRAEVSAPRVPGVGGGDPAAQPR